MNLYLNKPEFFYEMENLCRLFFPYESFVQIPGEHNGADACYISCTFSGDTITTTASVLSQVQTDVFTCVSPQDQRENELTMARRLYLLLSAICGFQPPWGILTGVRPAKLFSNLCSTMGVEDAKQIMQQELYVKPGQIALCEYAEMAEKQAAILCDASAFSLYVSIPFCPTRCSYCSFVSHSIEKTEKLVPRYVELLCQELKQTATIAKDLGLTLKSVYWGGGTPTQLSASQLDLVMTTIEECFDLSDLIEYTVEGGRPDTITHEKLEVLQQHGVTRLSINPQTMHDHVLQAIGRKHTAQQVLDAFAMAREHGFDNINMDVIAGLPEDTTVGFADTLKQLIALKPENITVHTLSLKRSARLAEQDNPAEYSAGPNQVADMLNAATQLLKADGFQPYYLYRQSKMIGNFENVGWCKPEKICYYNIYMMNELHTVLSVGAGGVTRLKDPHGEQITRIFNYKYPYEYMDRFDTLLERKKGIEEFYQQYPL